jgi:hypothetical protein
MLLPPNSSSLAFAPPSSVSPSAPPKAIIGAVVRFVTLSSPARSWTSNCASCEPFLVATQVTLVASPATGAQPAPAATGPVSSIVYVLPASVTRGLSTPVVPTYVMPSAWVAVTVDAAEDECPAAVPE